MNSICLFTSFQCSMFFIKFYSLTLIFLFDSQNNSHFHLQSNPPTQLSCSQDKASRESNPGHPLTKTIRISPIYYLFTLHQRFCAFLQTPLNMKKCDRVQLVSYRLFQLRALTTTSQSSYLLGCSTMTSLAAFQQQSWIKPNMHPFSVHCLAHLRIHTSIKEFHAFLRSQHSLPFLPKYFQLFLNSIFGYQHCNFGGFVSMFTKHHHFSLLLQLFRRHLSLTFRRVNEKQFHCCLSST